MGFNGKIKLVATDLDGTFLRNDKSISPENLNMLRSLGEKGIFRVIATGRNLEKTMAVIPAETPFDYVVFSSGAGVYDHQKNELLYSQNISEEVVQKLSDYLVECDLNFHLFKPVPNNHNCWYHRGSVQCSEFENYFNYLQSHTEPLPTNRPINSDACQFLVVFPNKLERFLSLKENIENQFPEVKVVRTSSPLETGYIWMEIFHRSVSKGNGVKFVCDSLNIGHEYTLGIGNDFNDLDLLEFTNYSYIVDNGPDELKSQFFNTRSNEENAFTLVVQKHI
ncbi:MAG TPA: HAD hydrolase family protein [Prolixibacteraceae bacterium]|nr:HAD hydrolase family protein [Prolixibacteraceae bacterium]HPR85417.1 HAD hydrolase family protein [Prolixibacteraceae bacterium]